MNLTTVTKVKKYYIRTRLCEGRVKWHIARGLVGLRNADEEMTDCGLIIKHRNMEREDTRPLEAEICGTCLRGEVPYKTILPILP